MKLSNNKCKKIYIYKKFKLPIPFLVIWQMSFEELLSLFFKVYCSSQDFKIYLISRLYPYQTFLHPGMPPNQIFISSVCSFKDGSTTNMILPIIFSSLSLCSFKIHSSLGVLQDPFVKQVCGILCSATEILKINCTAILTSSRVLNSASGIECVWMMNTKYDINSSRSYFCRLTFLNCKFGELSSCSPPDNIVWPLSSLHKGWYLLMEIVVLEDSEHVDFEGLTVSLFIIGEILDPLSVLGEAFNLW